MSTIGAATTGTVTVTNAIAITGDHDQLTAALFTPATKVIVSDATVIINDPVATSISATELSAIGSATTGKVTLTNSVEIRGNHDELLAALYNSDSRVFLGGGGNDATVTIIDADGTPINASELSSIGGQTNSPVTLSNSVNISGTTEQLIAALITDSSKVFAPTSNIIFSDTPTDSQFDAIDAITTGTLTLQNNGNNFNVTDNSISASKLISLNNQYSGTVNATAVTITGTAAEIITVYSSSGLLV